MVPPSSTSSDASDAIESFDTDGTTLFMFTAELLLLVRICSISSGFLSLAMQPQPTGVLCRVATLELEPKWQDDFEDLENAE